MAKRAKVNVKAQERKAKALKSKQGKLAKCIQILSKKVGFARNDKQRKNIEKKLAILNGRKEKIEKQL